MVQYTFNFHKNEKSFKLFLEYICVFEYTCTLHLFPWIYSNLLFYKMKYIYFPNVLPKLYSNIIYAKIIVKFVQNFEVGYTQTCTPLKNSTMWHPKKGHHSVLSPFSHLKFLFDLKNYIIIILKNHNCTNKM
jgi:hypothetical protein